MKSEKMAVLLLVLLLCAGSSIAQDLSILTVNIIAELDKIKIMNERIQKLEETLAKVLSENEVKRMDLTFDIDRVHGKKVAFSVGLVASGTRQTGPINTDKIMEYKKVFSNVGNAYDSNTGIFTAPIKGVYFFRFYGHCHSGNTMAVSLLKNGQIQCSLHDWTPPKSGNASNGVVLTLEIGDQIYTQLWKNTWVYDDSAGYTSFSGFLIFPL